MLKIVPIVLLYFFVNFSLLSQPVLGSVGCNDVVSRSASARLKKYLFCDYEKKLRGKINPHNKTTVFVSLQPKNILFDDDSGNMKLHGRLLISWTDRHLTWNASSFDNVTDIMLRSYEIWVPDIAVQSAGNWKFDQPRLHLTNCVLYAKGWIICSTPIDYKIRCQTDFTMWPFDRQNCTLVLASWSHTGDDIALNAETMSALIIDWFEPNGEWEVTVSRVFFEDKKIVYLTDGTSSMMSMDFIMDRAHNHLSGLFLSPAIILMVMTLTTLWLDPRSVERVALACLNPMIHLLCIRKLHWNLPHNGTTVPNIRLSFDLTTWHSLSYQWHEIHIVVISVQSASYARRLIANYRIVTETLDDSNLFQYHFNPSNLRNRNGILFYAYSLILATLTLILTFILGKIQETKSSAPKWITSSTNSILRSKVGQILLLSMLDPKAAAGIETSGIEADVDDTDNLVNSVAKKPGWGYVVILLSWISFISFLFAYVIMYGVLIPNSSMRPPVAAGKIPFFPY